MRAAGYPFHDPLYSLLFASGDFLPELRLTPSGVLEVKSRTVVRSPLRMAEMFIGGESLALPERDAQDDREPRFRPARRHRPGRHCRGC